METLAHLFGSTARVKLMRLFLFNPNSSYTIDGVAAKTRLTKATIKRELRLLEKTDLVRCKEVSAKAKITKKKDGTMKKTVKKKRSEYSLNPRFVFTPALRELLSLNDPVSHKDVLSKLRRAGKLRLVAVSGVFLGQEGSRVDLLVVGDDMNRGDIERAIGLVESDIGRELTYAAFDTSEFLYRASAKDRLLRDIFDFPHERILEKLTFEIF